MLQLICLIFYLLTYSKAEVALNNFFPFGPSNGDTIMARGDDTSSPKIIISENYRFFGLNQSFLWVNVNGAISFKTEIKTYTPSCGPVSSSYSMMAPYWADVDISTTGSIYYRESKDANVLQQANQEIQNAFPEMGSVNMTWSYIVTWYNVTYYPDESDQFIQRKRNYFQCALATDELFSYAIFYYNNLTWTTGDASGGTNGLGGTPAQAGFDAGDGVSRLMIDGSCTGDIMSVLMYQSNVGKPGVWVFDVANSTIKPPPTRSTTTSTPTAPHTRTALPTTVIASTPAPTSPLSNYDGTPCNCNKPTMWMDIIVIADKSKSVGIGGLGSIGSQLATIFYGMNIAQTGPAYYSRVSLILFSSDVKVVGTYYASYKALMKDLLNLESFHNQTDGIVDIYQALDTAQNIFNNQSNASSRQARKVVLLIASSYNQIGGNNPVVIANQMNNSNVFIITVDYQDTEGAATNLLSQISTPFMNFSSTTDNGIDVFDEVNSALCFANCICPKSMAQVITFNATSGRQTYWADCLIPFQGGSFAQFAEVACHEINGSLVTLTTSAKTDIVLNLAKQKLTSAHFHTGLHRNSAKSWVWYGYNGTEFPMGDYQPWAPGFNPGSAGDCVYIENLSGSTWGWMTENCLGQNPFQYICQIRACDSTYGTCDCSSWFNDPRCS